ncbi:unnamed protein product, partial [Didymodactylos carnosus]
MDNIVSDIDIPNDNEKQMKSKRINDYEWISILIPYIKEYNEYCSTCFENKQFGRTSNPNMSTSFIISCNIYSKRKERAFYSKLIVKPNGFIYIHPTKETSSHIITQYTYKLARPTRGSERQEIKELIAKGVK